MRLIGYSQPDVSRYGSFLIVNVLVILTLGDEDTVFTRNVGIQLSITQSHVLEEGNPQI